MEPEVYNKYTFKIVPPIVYAHGEVVVEDVVFAKTEAKAKDIMDEAYGKGRGDRIFKLVSVTEVTLFSKEYTNVGEGVDYE